MAIQPNDPAPHTESSLKDQLERAVGAWRFAPKPWGEKYGTPSVEDRKEAWKRAKEELPQIVRSMIREGQRHDVLDVLKEYGHLKTVAPKILEVFRGDRDLEAGSSIVEFFDELVVEAQEVALGLFVRTGDPPGLRILDDILAGRRAESAIESARSVYGAMQYNLPEAVFASACTETKRTGQPQTRRIDKAREVLPLVDAQRLTDQLRSRSPDDRETIIAFLEENARPDLADDVRSKLEDADAIEEREARARRSPVGTDPDDAMMDGGSPGPETDPDLPDSYPQRPQVVEQDEHSHATWDDLVQAWENGPRDGHVDELTRFKLEVLVDRLFEIPPELREALVDRLFQQDRGEVVYRAVAGEADSLWDGGFHGTERLQTLVGFASRHWAELAGYQSRLHGRMAAVAEFILRNQTNERQAGERTNILESCLHGLGRIGVLGRLASPSVLDQLPPDVGRMVVHHYIRSLEEHVAITWFAGMLKVTQELGRDATLRVLVATLTRHSFHFVRAILLELDPDTLRAVSGIQNEQATGLRTALEENEKRQTLLEQNVLKALADRIGYPLEQLELYLAQSIPDQQTRRGLIALWEQFRRAFAESGIEPAEPEDAPLRYSPMRHKRNPVDQGKDFPFYPLSRGILVRGHSQALFPAVIAYQEDLGSED